MSIEKICPACNNKFKVKPSHVHRRRYCSKDCMAEGYKENMLKEGNPHWKGGKITQICHFCNDQYQIISAKVGESRFCSNNCKSKSERSVNYKPKSDKKIIKEIVMPACKNCGKKLDTRKKKFCSKECLLQINNKRIIKRCPICFEEYWTYKSKIKKYCSEGCSGKAQSLRQSKDGSHFWQGGKVDSNMRIRNHSLYTEWRKKVFERDNYTCQSCLKHTSELERGRVTAHHIIPFKSDIKLRLKVSNGITLCWQCHKDFHTYMSNGKLIENEATLKNQVAKYFKTEPGVKFIKIHGNAVQEAGWPDFLGSVAGRFTAIELKVYPRFPTPLQIGRLRSIRKSGGAAFICRSIDEVKRVIKIVKETMWTGGTEEAKDPIKIGD